MQLKKQTNITTNNQTLKPTVLKQSLTSKNILKNLRITKVLKRSAAKQTMAGLFYHN